MTDTRHAAAQAPGLAGPATQRLQKRFAAALMPSYGLPPLALAAGRGCRVFDADGREYLDLIGRHPPGGVPGPHEQPVHART